MTTIRKIVSQYQVLTASSYKPHTVADLDSYPDGTVVYAPLQKRKWEKKAKINSAKKRNGNWDIYTDTKPEKVTGHQRGSNEGTMAIGVINFWLGEQLAVWNPDGSNA